MTAPSDTTSDIPQQLVEFNSFSSRLKVILQERQTQRTLINILAILLIAIVVHSYTGKFFTGRNLQSLSVQICVMTIIAFAQTLVMVAGCIDISVGGIVVMSSIVATFCVQFGMPLWLSFVIALLFGGVIGLFNAFLVLKVGITSMIATIGTMFILQGAANVITNGIPISADDSNFSVMGTGFVGPISISVIVMAVAFAVFLVIQRYTVLGRHSVAAGSNEKAAFLTGVNVSLTVTLCFVFVGAMAGWGGVMYASRIGAAIPAIDADLLFQVIVACVVGGTSLNGGEGKVSGTLFGAILIGVINNGLNLLGVSTYWQDIALGLILVLAVGLDNSLRQDIFFKIRKAFERVSGKPSEVTEIA